MAALAATAGILLPRNRPRHRLAVNKQQYGCSSQGFIYTA